MTTVRYTASSLAFNVGGVLGGALTPIVAQSLAARGGLQPVGIYMAGAALVSLIALGAAKKYGPDSRLSGPE